MKEYETKVMFAFPIFWELFRKTGVLRPLYEFIATDEEKGLKFEEYEGDIKAVNTVKLVLTCLTAGMIPVANTVSSRISLSVCAVSFWIVFHLANHYTNIKRLRSFEVKVKTFFTYFCDGFIEYSIICQPIEQIEKILLEKALLINDPKHISEIMDKMVAEIKLAEAVDNALSLNYMQGDSSRAYKRIWDELVPKAKKKLEQSERIVAEGKK